MIDTVTAARARTAAPCRPFTAPIGSPPWRLAGAAKLLLRAGVAAEGAEVVAEPREPEGDAYDD